MRADRNRFVRLRIHLIGAGFALVLAVIAAKAVYLQVFRGDWLSEKAAAQVEGSLVAQGKRGDIFDRQHRNMAASIDVTSIGVYPQNLENRRDAAARLAAVLKLNRRDLERRMAKRNGFMWVKRQVAPREARAVGELNLKGIQFITEASRFYPHKTLAGQVLGFSGIDGHGLEGIEFFYNQRISGEVARMKVLRDALGRGFQFEQSALPDPGGNNLILTIDRTIQHGAEATLADAVSAAGARSGIAIVMEPASGAILALAHYPFFNPNDYRSFSKEVLRNRAITDPFEPGSTMKIFTAAAAIESGLATPESVFFCENGDYRIGRYTIHDTHPHGSLSLREVVKVSSNIGAIKVAELIGPQNLYETLRRFGFGEKTGVDCPGETAGALAPWERWTRVDGATIAFGQGLSMSALQLVTAASSLANGGNLMRPYLVQAITDPNGRLIETFKPQAVRRVVSQATARTVIEMMKGVVGEGGTGSAAALERYTVCGKTGTAQKVDASGQYAKGKYVSSFIGFVPADAPSLVILVVIDEPQKAHYGGVVAAPAFKKIAQETLEYLATPPERDAGQLAAVLPAGGKP
jgi:cell division protein FtsI (penicillin-binding protein 3)